MVLGNFALIAGINPDEVNEWFWIVYADAYQWVELPNVTGMSLFADGGMLASKPYASGGGYINKMSDYCKNCHYNVKIKTGAEACPFNYLYWDFLIRNRKKLQNNPRMALMYKILDKTESKQLDLIKQQSKKFMEQINTPCK
jgi:deoxyribodipyrimidine photolyase-related protein